MNERPQVFACTFENLVYFFGADAGVETEFLFESSDRLRRRRSDVLSFDQIAPARFAVSQGRSVSVFDIGTTRNPQFAWEAHGDAVTTISSASPGPSIVATGSSDCTVRIWKLSSEAATGGIILEGHESHVCAVSCGPDSVTSSSKDLCLRIWDWNKGRCRGVMKHQAVPTRALCLNDTGRTAFVGLGQGCVQVWDQRNCLPVASLDVVQPHDRRRTAITDLAYRSSPGQLIATSYDGKITLYDTRKFESPVSQFRGHSREWLLGVCDVVGRDMFVTSSLGEIAGWTVEGKELWRVVDDGDAKRRYVSIRPFYNDRKRFLSLFAPPPSHCGLWAKAVLFLLLCSFLVSIYYFLKIR